MLLCNSGFTGSRGRGEASEMLNVRTNTLFVGLCLLSTCGMFDAAVHSRRVGGGDLAHGVPLKPASAQLF